LSALTASGLPFIRTEYSRSPSFAVPEGSTRFCALIALLTSIGEIPRACSCCGSRSTLMRRWRPPYGCGTLAPCTVARRVRMPLVPRSNSSCSLSVALDSAACSTGTFDALKRRMKGGCAPGGIVRMTVCEMADSCATADSILAPGWKKTLMTVIPGTDWDSMCSTSLTVVVTARSETVVMRRSISSGGRPAYCQITETTGMSISGKMSVGVRTSESTPKMTTSSAPTMNVYGRCRAIRTIHMGPGGAGCDQCAPGRYAAAPRNV
jgi:hypothetical protein